ncbi:hypothetical protein DN748_13260 [Sinomicrobium soli]|nr:hypothetical protein DN748_13260 [Sinomicrobium sp. N-1-3-6]
MACPGSPAFGNSIPGSYSLHDTTRDFFAVSIQESAYQQVEQMLLPYFSIVFSVMCAFIRQQVCHKQHHA